MLAHGGPSGYVLEGVLYGVQRLAVDQCLFVHGGRVLQMNDDTNQTTPAILRRAHFHQRGSGWLFETMAAASSSSSQWARAVVVSVRIYSTTRVCACDSASYRKIDSVVIHDCKRDYLSAISGRARLWIRNQGQGAAIHMADLWMTLLTSGLSGYQDRRWQMRLPLILYS